jgi:uncharacterized phage protein (TIGR02216 family)
MSLGLGVMRLAPAAFWALSLPEWRALAEGRSGPHPAPLRRGEFEHLMSLYPDQSHG